ncbi:tyrosine-protein phosphatase [Deinococcus apachensis]|uniref:tyrosine-protein phosphatase n=1 Tax=Deinococcus apachensis TaxID=309886 RepID=UPI000366CF3A|nr:tyrosine-protein phosphatase [Deinococcus apachensis]
MTSLAARRLSWGQCQNARDLGGLPTTDGRTLRPLALIRSDNHDRLGEAGVMALRQAGVRRVVDLRSGWEAERFPSPLKVAPEYLNVPLFDEADTEGRELVRAAETVFEVYQIMLERYPRHVVNALRAIADAPAGGVAVHCHAGKDRTGVVIALALHVAGVAPEVITADFALTDECLRRHYAEELAAAPDDAARARWKTFQVAEAGTMLATISHLQGRYGSVEGYLRAGGMQDETFLHLRTRLRA